MRHGLRLIFININFSIVHIHQFVPSFSQHILIFYTVNVASNIYFFNEKKQAVNRDVTINREPVENRFKYVTIQIG